MKDRLDRAGTPMKLPTEATKAWILSLLWLLLISWLAFLWNLGNIGLVDETEPLFAEAARQMTVTGDWITPYFNTETRFDKPVLIYWLMALAYKTIGVNEWAVRLPSALSAIALTVFGFYTLRYFGFPSPGAIAKGESQNHANNSKVLWLSALIGSAAIALNPETIAWGRTGVSDMLLSGCMGCALLAFFVGYAGKEKVKSQKVEEKENSLLPSGWYLAFYILIALAVLTKGPVGIVLPCLIVGAFLLYLGNFREVLREMRPLLGGLLVLAITLPWYVLVTLANGDAFINSFFGYHNLERFTGVVNHHDAPWYFYFLVVLVGFAPWSAYLPAAIARLRFWQRDRWRDSPRSTQLGLFALFWFAGVFGFFTIAVTKLPSYVLPLMPAAGILVALLFSSEFQTKAGFSFPSVAGMSEEVAKPAQTTQNRKIFFSGLFNLVFLLVLAGACFYSPQLLGYDPAAPNLKELLQASGLPVWAGTIWGTTAVILGCLLIKRQWRWLWSVNMVGFLAFIIFVVTPAFFLMDDMRQSPLRQMSAIATQVRQPGEELIMIGFKKPSVVFYTQRPVNYFSKSPKAMLYVEEQAARDDNPYSVLILARPKEIAETKLTPQQYQELGKAGVYELIRVSKQVVAQNSF